MNYLHDIQDINSHMPSERAELVRESPYWNDFESALEVLKHSAKVTANQRDIVLTLARETMLKDVSLKV